MSRKIPFLAIEGADGVGKSTVLRGLLPELVKRGEFNGFVFFHWKPLPGEMHRDEIPGDNPHDPRGKSPRGALASLAYLAYHWLTFWRGYLKFIRPELRKGALVIADRYAYDNLLDPTRFRINLPRWILRFFVRTIPRPDATLALVASPDVIRRRKPELDIEEIEAYQNALRSCRDIRDLRIVNADGTPAEVIAAALNALNV